MGQESSRDDLRKIRVEANTSMFDMMVGPPIISAFLAGGVTFGIVKWVGSTEEPDKNLPLLWLFPIFFVPLLYATVKYNLNRGRWLIEDGTLYRGRTPLFQLNDVEAVQIGLPDNWINAIANLPLKIRGTGGFQAAAIIRKNIVVLRLKDHRWMMWSGTQYTNFEEFRNTLIAAAVEKSIDQIPDSILPQLKTINVNRILYE